jgi:hypothetical protein
VAVLRRGREAANEAARRAVNYLLPTSGSNAMPECREGLSVPVFEAGGMGTPIDLAARA